MYKTINEIAKMEECSSISHRIFYRGFAADSLVKAKKNKWGHYIVESDKGMICLYRSSLAIPRSLECLCHLCARENEICQDCDAIWDFGK